VKSIEKKWARALFILLLKTFDFKSETRSRPRHSKIFSRPRLLNKVYDDDDDDDDDFGSETETLKIETETFFETLHTSALYVF